jgi:hypothetical protein
MELLRWLHSGEWDSTSYEKADPSRKSFLFTLKNTHNFPPRRFALKAEAKDKAIVCGSRFGPQLPASTFDTVGFGFQYTNDTEPARSSFFTSSEEFEIKEIGVFDVTI